MEFDEIHGYLKALLICGIEMTSVRCYYKFITQVFLFQQDPQSSNPSCFVKIDIK